MFEQDEENVVVLVHLDEESRLKALSRLPLEYLFKADIEQEWIEVTMKGDDLPVVWATFSGLVVPFGIPIIIGGKEYRTDQVMYQPMPHDHSKKVAKFYWATPDLVQKSIDTALAAKADWEKVPIDDKIKLFLKVADEISTTYRADLNATTMLGQSKTIIQAEIDAACELADFFRFNCFFAKELMKYQPISEDPNSVLNLMRYRPLEGFIASVTPFNFTAIAGNLAYTPCIMGNATLWKPSDTAILSNHLIYKIFREAGFPEGLVNFLPSDGPVFGKVVTSHPELAAVNFTGSVPTFQWLWKAVRENLQSYGRVDC